MKFSIFLSLALLTVITIKPAKADGLSGRIDNILGTIEGTMDKSDSVISRTSNTAERLNSKAPAAGGQSSVTTKDQKTLDETKRIEEERILKRAERIRAKQATPARRSNDVSKSERRY